MKTSTKWIVGILVGVIGIVAIAGLCLLSWNIMGSGGWEYGMRSGRLWEDGPVMPREFNPRTMPMHTNYGSWFGFFGLLRIIGFAIFCLGVPALLILGVFLLVKNLQKPPQQVPPPQTPVPQASAPQTSAPQPPAPQPNNCSSCGREVQEGWSHCPYCGNNL